MYKVVILISILLLINFIGCFEKTTTELSRNMDERLIGTWTEIKLSIDEYIFYSYGHVSYQCLLWNGSHDCETINEKEGGGEIIIYHQDGTIKQFWQYEIEDDKLTLWTPKIFDSGNNDIHYLTKN
jgi:hypothetical protein